MKVTANEWGGVAAMAALGAIGLMSEGMPFFEAIGEAVVFTSAMVGVVAMVKFIRERKN